MNKQFVIADIHGMFYEFMLLLEHWDKQNEDLIIVGNLINQGIESFLVVKKIIQLCEDHDNVFVLKGNHEQLLEYWVQDPVTSHEMYTKFGGLKTLYSFLEDPMIKLKRANKWLPVARNPIKLQELFTALYKKEIDFLIQRPLYKEYKETIYVHAGLDLTLSNWRETPPNDMLWLKDTFYLKPNTTGKTIVFGHTPLSEFKEQRWLENNIWNNEKNRLIGINGEAFSTGKLNAIRMENGLLREIVSTSNFRKIKQVFY